MSDVRHDSSRERRRTLINVASNWGAFVVNAVVGFFLTPFIVHRLGDDAYGAWVLLGSLVGYLGLLDLGVRSAVTRYVANHHAAGRHDEAGRIVSAAISIFAGAGLAAILAAAGLAWLALDLFDLPPELVPVARTVLILGGATIAASLCGGTFGGILTGLQRFDLSSAINVAAGLLRAAAILVGLGMGGGLLTLAWIQLAASVATGIVSAVAARRVYPGLPLRLRAWGRREARAVLSFGFFASLIQVFAMLINYSDALVIGVLLPVAQITFFAIAAGLMDYSRQVVSGIAHVLAPMAGALEGGDRIDEAAAALMAGARWATLLSLPIVAVFVLRGGSFIDLWMGPGYGAASGPVLAILAFGRWGAASFHAASSGLTGLNRHRGLAPAIGVEAAANIVLSVLLAGPLGIAGVALGTTIPRLAVALLFGPAYVQRTLGIALTRYLGETLLRPTLATLPFAAVCWATERALPAEGLITFFAQIAAALPVWAVGAWILSLTPAERRLLGDAIRRRR